MADDHGGVFCSCIDRGRDVTEPDFVVLQPRRLPAENQRGCLRRPKIRGGSLRSHHFSDKVPLPPSPYGGGCDQKIVDSSKNSESYCFSPAQHIITMGGVDGGIGDDYLGICEEYPAGPKVLPQR